MNSVNHNAVKKRELILPHKEVLNLCNKMINHAFVIEISDNIESIHEWKRAELELRAKLDVLRNNINSIRVNIEKKRKKIICI